MGGTRSANRLLLWCLLAVFAAGGVALGAAALGGGGADEPSDPDAAASAAAPAEEPPRAPTSTVALDDDELYDIEEDCEAWLEWDEFSGAGREAYEDAAAYAGPCVRAAVLEHGASVREYFGLLVYAECDWFEAYATDELFDSGDLDPLRSAHDDRDQCIGELAPTIGEDPAEVIAEFEDEFVDDPAYTCLAEHSDDSEAFRCIEEVWFNDIDSDGMIGDQPPPSTVRECLEHVDPVTGQPDGARCVDFLPIDDRAEMECGVTSGTPWLFVSARSAGTDLVEAWSRFVAYAPCFRDLLLAADPAVTELSDEDLLALLHHYSQPWSCLAPLIPAPPTTPELTPEGIGALRCIEGARSWYSEDLDGDGVIGPP